MISVTISLPTLVHIANALDTTVDRLLYDNTQSLFTQYDADFKEVTDGCSPQEKAFLLELLLSAKNALRNHKFTR